MTFKEHLILEITKASVAKNGVDVNNSNMHAEAILALVTAIVDSCKKGED